MQIRLNPDDDAYLNEVARRRGVSKNQVIIDLLRAAREQDERTALCTRLASEATTARPDLMKRLAQ